jgi:anti-sigma-K factor RskA
MTTMPTAELSKAARDVEDLLPFHAAGSLSASDRARVERALAADAELRRRLALIQDEMAETILLNEAVRGPSPQALGRLMAAVEAEPAQVRHQAAAAATAIRTGLAERFAGWLQALQPRRLAYAAAAAAVVVALQAGALVGLIASRDGGSFETASSGQQAAARADLTVIFTDQATAAEISALLSRSGLVIVRGPLPGGIYQLQASGAAPDRAGLERLIQALRAEPSLIRLASPA